MKTRPAPDSVAEDAFLRTRRSLLSRLRDLDDDASWRDFFNTYWKLIYRAATRAGLSNAEAQDVVQDTVITVARRIQEFRYDPARGTFKGWLLHTTRWRILDHLRKRDARPPADPLPDAKEDCAWVENVATPASALIESVWEAEWQQNLMDAAIQRVKHHVRPKHYQAFELYVLKEWPALKVAQALGIHVAQVHLLKHRVGNLIRKEVKRLEGAGI
jgi:RNA polymerase sigma-70 factor (ECF subfamily)